MTAELRYRFAPHPHGGFVLGFRLAQLVGFLIAGALAVALLSLGGFLALLLIALDASVAVGVLVVTVRGHTLEEWAPLCLRFLTGRISGRHWFRSAQPTLGHIIRLPTACGLDPHPVGAPISLPAELAELELLEGELHAGGRRGAGHRHRSPSRPAGG